MANELYVNYASGNTLWAAIRNAAGEVWYPTGEVFEAWGTSSRTAADYDIAMTDKTGSRYVGDFDGNIAAGRYWVQFFLQAGGSPANGDTCVGGYEVRWSGTGQITADKMLVNKAAQNKSSGAITYYDDDGETALMTASPTDGATTITRTPS